MEREEQLRWERQWGPGAAVAAFAAALLAVGATVYSSSLIGSVPTDREDIFLQKIDQHGSCYILAGIVTGIGTIALAPVLVYLYRAIVARGGLIPRLALILAIAAPLAAGGVGVARQVVLVNVAGDFVKQQKVAPTAAQKAQQDEKLGSITDPKAYKDAVDKLGPTGIAKEKLKSGSVATVAYIGLVVNMLLGIALVLVSLHAMRVGLMSRFMGVLGIIVGVLTVIPILGGAPVVQLFWLIALGLLFLNRWPQGRGPAWESGEAIPWPTAQARRDAAMNGGDTAAAPAPASAGRRGRAGVLAAARDGADEEPDEDEDEVVETRPHTREAARPRPTAQHPRSKKRKRKRRG